MADVESTPAAVAESPKSAKKTTAAKKTKAAKVQKPAHPATSVMVMAAIKALKERGGSSLKAIKKYIGQTYKIDADKSSHFIKKFLRASVASGELVQTKGTGASGSFKLPVADKKPAAKPKKAVAKPAAKKAKSPAKKVAVKAAPKAKKTTKPPTKPKSPKAKTTKVAVKSTRRSARN